MMMLLAALGLASATAGWDSYVPRTLRSVIDANRDQISHESTYVFTASNFPTRAKVVYQGQTRPIPESRKEFIARYLGKVRQHPEWAALYSEEVHCREGEDDYWLPIQSTVLAYFKDEVTPGDSVELFVTWIGAIKNEEQIDWVFTINEFQVVTGSDGAELPKVSQAQKAEFLKMLNKLPHDGEFLTEKGVDKGARFVDVLFALMTQDVDEDQLYRVLALSRGLCDRAEYRTYGVQHFSRIAHPTVKAFWTSVLFDESSGSPEILQYLKQMLRSEEGARMLAEILGPEFDAFENKVAEAR